MKERPGVQVELGWGLGITVRGQDTACLGRDVDLEIIPGVAFSQAVSALAETVPAVQPHKAAVLISWERHSLLWGGYEVEALPLLILFVDWSCSQLLCRFGLGLGLQGSGTGGRCLSHLQLMGLGDMESNCL